MKWSSAALSSLSFQLDILLKMEVRGEEREAVFWLVREALSARLLWEKLGYDARHVAEGQERDVQRSTVKSSRTCVLYWLFTVLHRNHIGRTI